MAKIIKIKPSTSNLAPAGLSADAATYYRELTKLAGELYPVLPIDGALIEVAARNFQMAREASEAANEDLRLKDVRAWISAQKLALSAGAALRSALTALKLSPEERSGKATAQVQAVKVLKGDSVWGDLLN
jgi:hypothetical protein